MNAALELVENHRHDGIVYFTDEEDVYSLHLFDRLHQIRY
jgi:putative beta-1,4-xylosyltransferase IRX9